MSLRPGKHLALSGIDYSGKTTEQLRSLFRQTLEGGMHGLCYSAYEEGKNQVIF